MIGPIGSFPIQCFIYSLACESHIYTDGNQHGDEDRTRYIPHICHFYTHTFSGLKILHSKARKFATKIASRQNSVNQYWRKIHIYIQFFV